MTCSLFCYSFILSFFYKYDFVCLATRVEISCFIMQILRYLYYFILAWHFSVLYENHLSCYSVSIYESESVIMTYTLIRFFYYLLRCFLFVSFFVYNLFSVLSSNWNTMKNMNSLGFVPLLLKEDFFWKSSEKLNSWISMKLSNWGTLIF